MVVNLKISITGTGMCIGISARKKMIFGQINPQYISKNMYRYAYIYMQLIDVFVHVYISRFLINIEKKRKH